MEELPTTFTREEIIQAARDEINEWKFESKKWTGKDFEYLGFVASVVARLTVTPKT